MGRSKIANVSSGERGRPVVARDAGDAEVALAAAVRDHADAVTDPEVLRIGRLGVDHHLARACRPGAGHQPERAEAPVARGHAPAELERAPARDHLPVGTDDLGLPADRTAGGRHPRERLDPPERRLRKRRRSAASAERRLARHDRVGVGVDAGEQRAQARVDGVGEDERPAHHGDAHHDRERGQRQAQLASRAGSSWRPGSRRVSGHVLSVARTAPPRRSHQLDPLRARKSRVARMFC